MNLTFLEQNDDDLPFSSTNSSLQVLHFVELSQSLNFIQKNKIKQWLKFNLFINTFDENLTIEKNVCSIIEKML